MYCELVSACIIADDFEDVAVDKIASVFLGHYIGAELYFLARVKRRANCGRVSCINLALNMTHGLLPLW
jgi:hypothetical protein